MDLSTWFYQNPWSCLPMAYLFEAVFIFIVAGVLCHDDLEEIDGFSWGHLALTCLFWLPGMIYIKSIEVVGKFRFNQTKI